MTAVEIDQHYPSVFHAIAWTELFLCASADDPRDVFVILRSSPKRLGLEEVLEYIRDQIREEIKEDSPGKHELALAETELPAFRTYVAAKMGAM